jgi:lipopolysaccharide transport system permease protein
MTGDVQAPAVAEVVIEPTRSTLRASIRDVLAYSALLRFLISRDLKSRYRPTNLGRLWIFLRPLMEMLTYVVIFGYVLGVRSTHLPYPLHIYSGLVVWILFSGVVSASTTSLASNRHLMSKVYFPRLIVPLVTLGLAVMDFLVAGSLLLLMMVVYGVLPAVQVLMLPLFLLLLVALTFGVGLIVAATSVDTADIGIALPVALRILMYASPVTYPLELVPTAFRSFYLANPLAAILEGVRWSLFGTPWPGTWPLLAATGGAFAVLLFGLSRFRATERRLVDFL